MPEPTAEASIKATVYNLAQAWRRDLLENVVPFWLKHSLDHVHGGYFTALGREGELLDDSKYVWLQGRAVFMWSRLHNQLGKDVGAAVRDQWFAAAQLGADWTRQHGKDSDGRLYFAVSRDGSSPLHFQRKPYAATFHVLGCLEFADALRRRADSDVPTDGAADPQVYLDEAVAYFELLRSWVDDPSRLGRLPPSASPVSNASGEPGPPAALPSVLAEVMCLSSLSLELLDKLPERRDEWLEHVRDAQRRVKQHYDPKRRILMEQVLEAPIEP